VSFNGEPAKDMLDVAYFDSQSEFAMTVVRNEREITFDIKKDAYMPMGWDFYDQCYIEPRWCANKCVFCFVDQLPKGQRPTLYVKDDDWRLSFVSGNYVTLTNITDAEIERIISKLRFFLRPNLGCGLIL
jgi:NifB/MoaA-like Fe-S oxidoreductase